MKVYYDLFQSHQSPKEGNETFEKIQKNVGRITVPDGSDVGDLKEAVYKREEPRVRHCSVTDLSIYPHGTDMESPTLEQQICDIDSKVPATTQQTPLIITSPLQERSNDETINRYNARVTLRSHNGTALATYLLTDVRVPTTASAFWELIGFQDGPSQGGKVTVKLTNDSWTRLSEISLDTSLLKKSGGAVHFQIQRRHTRQNSPTGAGEKESTNREELVSVVRDIFSQNPFVDEIGELHKDTTIDRLVEIFDCRKWSNDDPPSIATVLAMPGSGKSRSVREAASLAQAKRFRWRICRGDDLYKLMAVEVLDRSRIENFVLGLVLKNIERETLPGDWTSTFVVHFDEIQVLVGLKGGEEKLKYLSEVCNMLCNSGGGAKAWLKFVFTGTNINAERPIRFGSELKAEPIPLTGTFPVDFVIQLFQRHISEPSEECKLILEKCRHNRRVAQRFLRNAWDHNKAGHSPDSLSSQYSEACNFVASSISTQIGNTVASPSACRIFRLVLETISEGKVSTEDGLKILKLKVDEKSTDLAYIQGGGLNVHSIGQGVDAEQKREISVYNPEGCVLEILSLIMGRAVPSETITNLLSFLQTSQVKTYTLGWFFEALVVYDLQCAESEFESQLGVGRRQHGILNAAVTKVPQIWARIPTAPEELIWWVRDEMNSHQNRWIDIAYRQDDGSVVLIECKSGITTKNSGAATTFFKKAAELAAEHETVRWIAVFVCVANEVDAMETDADNLTTQVMKIEKKRHPFLYGVFDIARQFDKEQVALLAREFEAKAVLTTSSGVYPGGTPDRSK